MARLVVTSGRWSLFFCLDVDSFESYLSASVHVNVNVNMVVMARKVKTQDKNDDFWQ